MRASSLFDFDFFQKKYLTAKNARLADTHADSEYFPK
jgi:hypothetical protein